MNINIYNYLHNLEKMDLPNKHGVLLEDEEKIKHAYDSDLTHNLISYYDTVNNIGLYVKRFIDHNDKNSDRFISELLTSRIYEKNNINCVRTYPFRRKGDDSKFICTATEDMCKLDGLDVSDNNDFMMEILDTLFETKGIDLSSREYLNEWLILVNPNIRELLLSHMTEESYEELINLMIADVLFYNFDRFGGGNNLFFVKQKEANKSQSVVPFDLEGMDFDALDFYFFNSVNKFINEMYSESVQFTTAHGSCICIPYDHVLKNLSNLLKDGRLGVRQKILINNILGLNIRGEIETILNKYNLDISKKAIKIYDEVWKRNSDILRL